MKKSIYIILIAAIGAVLFGEQLINFAKLGVASLMDANIFQNETQEEVKGQVVLEINNGDGEVKTVKTELVKGMTALKLLQDKVIDLDLDLRTRTYSTGTMIEAVGDKENGKDDKYWLYYVNGEMAQVAADKKELNPGDKVEFKFEKSPF